MNQNLFTPAEISKSLLRHRGEEPAPAVHQQLPRRDGRAAARRLGPREPDRHQGDLEAEAEEEAAAGGHGEASEGEGRGGEDEAVH